MTAIVAISEARMPVLLGFNRQIDMAIECKFAVKVSIYISFGTGGMEGMHILQYNLCMDYALFVPHIVSYKLSNTERMLVFQFYALLYHLN